MNVAIAGFTPTQQLSALSTSAQSGLGNATFPPAKSTLAGATQPPIARFAAGFLNAVLPTNGVSQVQSPFSTAPISNPGAPTGVGSNTFSASYAPQIYAVYINGLIANQTVSSAALETNLYHTDIAKPPISGDPSGQIPGTPPVQPIPQVEGTQQVIAAIAPLAGSGTIFSSGSGQTVTASTAAVQSSASHSTPHATSK